ncbi:hypothetical protein G9A89_010608 [Geosiphon pyriformis]|nr:hypothetical protein G9A89_010608 [Geosiphon pyriformis]
MLATDARVLTRHFMVRPTDNNNCHRLQQKPHNNHWLMAALGEKPIKRFTEEQKLHFCNYECDGWCPVCEKYSFE